MNELTPFSPKATCLNCRHHGLQLVCEHCRQHWCPNIHHHKQGELVNVGCRPMWKLAIDKHCQGCKFWFYRAEGVDPRADDGQPPVDLRGVGFHRVGIGECRINPPPHGGTMGAFPLIQANCWCGKWEDKG